MRTFTKHQVECTQNYDPYYGFKVIEQGAVLTAEVDSQSSVVTLLDGTCIVGTASRNELALHFAVKGE